MLKQKEEELNLLREKKEEGERKKMEIEKLKKGCEEI